MSKDVRTPEQKAAVVKCRFCPWSIPQYRQSDGEPREDVDRTLYWHVKQNHPEQAGLVAKVREEIADSYRRERSARRLARGGTPGRRIG